MIVKMMAKQRRLPTTAAIITIAVQFAPSHARKQKIHRTWSHYSV